MFESLAAIAIASISDRVRGSGETFFVSSAVWGALLFVTSLYVAFGYWMPLVALGYLLGEIAGWGHVLGSALSKDVLENRTPSSWQIGFLKTNIFAALVVRGLIWAVPVALCAAAYDVRLAVAVFFGFLVSFVTAPYIARQFTKLRDDRTGGIVWQNWMRMEHIRGALCMLIILIMTKGA